jgi:hypothetical protein
MPPRLAQDRHHCSVESAGTSVTPPRSALRVALGLVLFVQALYLLSASGHLRGQDQEYFYRMACSIAREHTFAIEPLVLNNRELAGARGRDGKFYAQYAPGLPLLLAPIVLLGDKISEHLPRLKANYQWPHQDDQDIAPRILISYFNIPVTAVTAGLLTLLVTRLGYPIGAGIFAGLSFAVSSFAWGQARIIFAEPLQGLFLLAGGLLLLRATPAQALLGGCMLALAILVKITSILALPAFLLLPNEHGELLCRRRSTLVALIVPVVISLGAYGWYNWIRFGGLTATGYSATYGGTSQSSWNPIGNPLVGLYGLLLSPGRGVLWYAPLIAIAAVSARHFYSERPVTGRAFIVLAAAWLAAHSAIKGWEGGWGWGPRYLLPVLPFLLVPLAAAWRSFKGKLACLGLFVVGVVVQLPGALIDFITSGRESARVFVETCKECTERALNTWRDFNISGSEIVRHSSLLLHGQLDLAWLTFSNTSLPLVTFGLAILLVLCGLALMTPPLIVEAKNGVIREAPNSSL